MPYVLDVLPVVTLQLGDNAPLLPGIAPAAALVVTKFSDCGCFAFLLYRGGTYCVPAEFVATRQALAAIVWTAAGCPLPGACGM
jgi:hypothetical protein